MQAEKKEKEYDIPAEAKLKGKVAEDKEEVKTQEGAKHPGKEGNTYLEKMCKHSEKNFCLFVAEKCLHQRTPKQRRREEMASLTECASQGVRE